MNLSRSHRPWLLLAALGAASLAAFSACSSSSSGTGGGTDAGDTDANPEGAAEGGTHQEAASETGTGEDGSSSGGGTSEAGPDATTQDGGDAGPHDAGPGDASAADQVSGDGPSPDASDAGPCPGAQLFCHGICVPNDTANCGACGNDCNNLHATSTPTCTAGACAFPALTCAAGWAHCSSNASDGCETDITTAAHCGSCSNVCPGAAACSFSSADAGASFCVKPIALAAASQSTFALFSDGTMKVWGSNSGAYYFAGNMFGNGDTTTAYTSTPVTVSITNAIAVAAGDGHACVLLADHTVSCWGDNTVGQCGHGTSEEDGGTDSVVTPLKVEGLGNVIAISAAYATTCALLSGGSVECWGLNIEGELGNNTTAQCDGANWCSSTPVPVSGITTATAIATSGYSSTHFGHTCALLTGGTIKCWGANDDGQLGNGTRAPSAGPYAVYTPTQVSGITTAIGVSSWEDGSCALLSGGSVKCWGSNPGGVLGNGSMNLSATPVPVSNLSDAVSLSMGPQSETNCAVHGDAGTAECWGNGGNGQLGNGTPLTTTSDVPVAVSNLTGVTHIVGSKSHECALLSTGAVYCWGDDFYGMVGNSTANDTNPNPTPLPVQW